MHTLICFLGKTQTGVYRNASYRFDEKLTPGGMTLETQSFALAAYKALRPQRLVLLGTGSSMWDGLLSALGLHETHASLCERVRAQCAAGTVDQALLDEAQDLVQAQMRSALGQADEAEAGGKDEAACAGDPLMQVELGLIAVGESFGAQLSILKAIADRVDAGSTLSLDITHGLRHLPMLVMASAVYLRRVKHVEIKHVLYGALDLTARKESGEDETPVIDLSGLLRILDWTSALDQYRKDLDFGVFIPLLKGRMAGDDLDALKRAAHHQRLGLHDQARKDAHPLLGAMNGSVDKVFQFFLPELRKHISEMAEEQLYASQRRSAIRNLEAGDSVRALISAYEAFVTRVTLRNQLGQNAGYASRQKSIDSFRDYEEFKKVEDSVMKLRNLRNVVAHGDGANAGRMERDLATPESLERAVRKLIAALLPETLPPLPGTHRLFDSAQLKAMSDAAKK